MTEQTADVVNIHDKPAGAIDVPGGWIVLRDPLTVRAGDRRKVSAAIDRASIAGAGNIMRAYESAEATMILAIESWSFDGPVPKDVIGTFDDEGNPRPNPLDEMEIPTYDAIADACTPFAKAIFPNFGTPSSDTSKSDPSGPSSA
jgi:hypothetical protein